MYLRSLKTILPLWEFQGQDTNTTYTLGSFGITATAAEINKLDGLTATTAELNYVDGVTSNIQTQLNGKSPTSHSHSAATTSANGSCLLAIRVNSMELQLVQITMFTQLPPVINIFRVEDLVDKSYNGVPMELQNGEIHPKELNAPQHDQLVNRLEIIGLN